MTNLRLNPSSLNPQRSRPWAFILAFVTLSALSFSFFQSFSRHEFRGFEGGDSLTQFWDEVQLKSEDLKTVFESDTCRSDDEHRLACQYSLSLMALSESLEWNADRHAFDKIQSLYPQIAWTEKEWIDHLRPQTNDSTEMWQALLKAKHMRSETVGLGFNAYFGVTIDPHSYLFPFHAYENSFFKSKQQLIGQFAYQPDGIHLKNLFPHTALFDKGLHPDARLEKIDGVDADTYTLSKLQEKLSSLGTKTVELKFENQPALRLDSGDLLMPHVRSFSIPSDRGEVAIIEIHKFVNDTCDLVQKEVKNHVHASGLILDMRGNPGGQVDEAVCVARLFLKNGQKIFEMKDLNGNFLEAQYSNHAGLMTTTPMAILVDNGTASSAEIVSGALKDLKRATLVGERTFGKGTFQDGRVWEKNSKVLFFQTSGFYYFNSGWTPQLVGIQADYLVPHLEKDTSALRREDSAFFQPLRPFDLWTGPQESTREDLTLNSSDCDNANLDTSTMADTFIMRAQNALSCSTKLKNHFSGRL